MAIEAVEAEAVVEQNAKSTHGSSSLRARGLVTPSQPANQDDEARWSLATLWAGIFRRASDDPQIPGEAWSGHSGDGTDCGKPRDTRFTELLARASRGGNNNEQDFAPRRPPTQRGGAN
jgi:hypothetical protein